MDRSPSRRRDDDGFTLIELLVVVIIIGVLAAIAVPSFLGQRSSGRDAAAKSLVRNAEGSMETYFAEHHTYATATPARLTTIEPNIVWRTGAALADNVQVRISGLAVDTYTLQTRSASGETFAIKRLASGASVRCLGNAAAIAACAANAW